MPEGFKKYKSEQTIGHSEKSICCILDKKYTGNCKYKLSNKKVFDWNSDFFIQKRNGYSIEFEIKISKQDFLSDKNKIKKHSILENGTYRKLRFKHFANKLSNITELIGTHEDIKCNFRPNQFFYVVPKDLININDIPSYAGLMYVIENDIYIVKDAPFIHKELLNYEKVLCEKFYTYWKISKIKIKELEKIIDRI